MSAKYEITQNNKHLKSCEFLSSATDEIQFLLSSLPDGMLTTFSVVNEDDYLLASATNRRIIGEFLKQEWGGAKNDDAISCGSVSFDATDAILLLTHSQLMNVKDNSDSSDNIGQDHVQWSGPFEVSIVDSICEYFGVSELVAVTPEALLYARTQVSPLPPQEVELTIQVAVRVRLYPGADVSKFAANSTVNVSSEIDGVFIRSASIIK